jgi:hypothetical protein
MLSYNDIKNKILFHKGDPTKIFNDFDFWEKSVKILIDVGWSPK